MVPWMKYMRQHAACSMAWLLLSGKNFVSLCGAWGSHSGVYMLCSVMEVHWHFRRTCRACAAYISALKLDAFCTSKMSVDFYQTVWCHIIFMKNNITISQLCVMFVWWCVYTLWSMYMDVYWCRVYVWAVALDLACELNVRRIGQWLHQHYGVMSFN